MKRNSEFIYKTKKGLKRADLILKNKNFTNNKVLKSKVNELKKVCNKIENINDKLNVLIDKRIPLNKERNDLISRIQYQYKHLEKLKKTRYTCHYCKKKFQPKQLNKKFKFCSSECDYQNDLEKNRIKNAPIIRKRKERILNKKIKERERVEKQLLKRLSKIKNIKQKLNKERNNI